jgi:hypothetical protein
MPTRGVGGQNDMDSTLGGASEGLLRPLIDALPVLVAYVDLDERYRLNNKAYEHLLEEIKSLSLSGGNVHTSYLYFAVINRFGYTRTRPGDFAGQHVGRSRRSDHPENWS